MIIYDISEHAYKRYAQRIAHKNEERDINIYVVNNRERIQQRISKMVEFGKLIHKEKSRYGSIVETYLCHTWVIILSPSTNKVITLYPIDLGETEKTKRCIERHLLLLERNQITIRYLLHKQKELERNGELKSSADIKEEIDMINYKQQDIIRSLTSKTPKY